MNIFDLQATIGLNAEGFMNGVHEAQGAFSGLGSSLGAGAVAVGNMISGMVTTAASDLADFGKSVVQTGETFDASMSNVKAISGATAEEFEALREKAKEMGASTKFTASESADAFSYMAMAGWKTQDMLDGITGIMNLAAASGEDLATTSDIVTDALTAFGLKAEDSAHFADVLAAASSNANTNVRGMGETFKYAAPVAGALGFTIEDTAQAIGLMANAGIKGTQAGTALRSIFTRLSKPTKESQGAMNALGLEIDDADGKMKSLGEIMEDIREGFAGNLRISTEEYSEAVADLNAQLEKGAITKSDYASSLDLLDTRLNGSSESVQALFAAMLGGQEAMSGLLAIVNASEDDFSKLQNAISGASGGMDEMGAAAQMAETQLNNLQGDVTIFQSAFDGLKTAIYDSFKEPMRDAVQTATEAITSLTEGFEQGGLKGALSSFGDFVKEKLSGLWDNLKLPPGLEGIKTFFEDLTESVKPVVETFNEAGGISETVSSFAGSVGEFLKAFATAKFETIKEIAGAVEDFFSGFSESPAAEAVGGLAEKVGAFFETFLKVSADTVSKIADAVKRFLDKFDGFKVGEGFGEFVASVSDLLSDIVSVAGSTVEKVADAIGVLLDNADVGGIGEGLSDFITFLENLATYTTEAIAEGVRATGERLSGFIDVVKKLAEKFGPAINTLMEALGKFLEKIFDFARSMEDAFAPIREFLGNTLATLFQNALYVIGSVISGIISAVGNWLDAMMHGVEIIKKLLSGDLTGAFNELLGAAWDTITGIADLFAGLIDPIMELAPQMWQAGKDLLSGLWEGMKSVFDGIKNWVTDKVGGLVDTVKGIFKIGSPSKVFADIGKNVVLGFGVGWDKEFGPLERSVGDDMEGLTKTARIGFESSAIGKSSAAGISSMLAAGDSGTGEPLEINLILDGDVAATALFDPLRRVAWQKGRGEEPVYA